MKDLKKEYEQVSLEREDIIVQIEHLKESEIIKKYFNLLSQSEELSTKKEKLYEQIKKEEYSSCNHIWIPTYINNFVANGVTYHTCVKCGLDENVSREPMLGLEKKIMWNYIFLNPYRTGIYIQEVCDINLARDIYMKIIMEYPDLDDKNIADYLDIAIRDIQNHQSEFTKELEDRFLKNIGPKLIRKKEDKS